MIRFTRLAPGQIRVRAIAEPVGASAIGILCVVSDSPRELDDWLTRSGLGLVGLWRIRVAEVFGVDEAVVTRTGERTLLIMPHGGRASLSAMGEALVARGGEACPLGALEPSAVFPFAGSERLALAMALLSVAASPLAVDVLAAQGWFEGSDSSASEEDSFYLHRLLVPPTVAAVGPANIGKSTLLNALARRSASLVSDERGTTRDHVGVLLTLDGLAARWLDTPGLRSLDPAGSAGDAAEARARELAFAEVRAADAVVLCADHDGAFPQWPMDELRNDMAMIRVRLRCDRAGARVDESENDSLGREVIRTGVPELAGGGTGLQELASSVRMMLVPDAWLARALATPIDLLGVAAGMGFARAEISR